MQLIKVNKVMYFC